MNIKDIFIGKIVKTKKDDKICHVVDLSLNSVGEVLAVVSFPQYYDSDKVTIVSIHPYNLKELD